jgi:hypothetical protein
MTFSESAAPSAETAQPSAQDAQKLIALLSSMMPLLLRMQSQGFPSQGFPSQGFQSQGFQSQGFEPLSPFAPPGVVPENPVLDRQAAANLAEDMTADLLRTLSAYLDNYAEQYPSLNPCIGLVTRAADCFAAHDYAQSFGLIWQSYRLITALRASNPQLPPPRAIVQSALRPATQLH